MIYWGIGKAKEVNTKKSKNPENMKQATKLIQEFIKMDKRHRLRGHSGGILLDLQL